MKRILLTLSLSCALTLTAAAQFGPQGPESRVITDTIHSDILSADRAYNIFLPKSYDQDTDRQYPILYLLHGMLDTNLGWYTRGHVKDVMDQLVASGEACEMIIVTPCAGGNVFEGVWNGYFNMPGWAYEDFFYQEFMPYIEQTYRVKADKQHRAIAGLSMGGGGTTSYAQRYPDLYCAAYAMSALMTLEQSNRGGVIPGNSAGDRGTQVEGNGGPGQRPGQRPEGGPGQRPQGAPDGAQGAPQGGPDNAQGRPKGGPGAGPGQQQGPNKFMLLTQSVNEHSCVRYVQEADDDTKAKLRTVSWFVDCGDDDFLLDYNLAFYQAMRQAQIPCQFRMRDGGHTWEYWHSALYNCLAFVTRVFFGVQ